MSKHTSFGAGLFLEESAPLKKLAVRLVFPLHGHGSKSRTPGEHPSHHSNRPKWVVHLLQNGTIGFDPQPHTFHLLKNIFHFPLLVLKGIYRYWTFFSRGLKQLEVTCPLGAPQTSGGPLGERWGTPTAQQPHPQAAEWASALALKASLAGSGEPGIRFVGGNPLARNSCGYPPSWF